MIGRARASLASASAALGVATCCVAPMAMMLLGFGGGWLVVFGAIAAASWYVLAGATAIIAYAWISAPRGEGSVRLKSWLAVSTSLTALAWVVVLNEARINDFLITLM